MRAASPSKTERCPVCGMFVAGYSNWFAGVQFKDGSHATFDGPKDLFKYLAAMKRYEKKRTDADLVATYVTDYYRVRPVDARKAFYVTKSNVYGPMGEEYVPFENESDAAEFLRDHKGKKVLTFSEALAEVRALEAKP
ncbi:MAG: nitrous oxide reductase accessory protein NosL [Deltaproteobacteria bacterium]|nr:nitrous oxide reductase accessory protein NosL [Deltaproteobacteria bacterium]